MPLVGPTVVYALQAHMLEQIRRDVIGAADLASGEIGGTADLTVCFADLVEFTRLGEEIAAEELGLVAGRLEEMATAVAEPPVRLVKTIGDAVMLVSSEPEPMVARGAGADRRRRGRRRASSPGCAPASPAARRCRSRATTTAARSTSPAASPASPAPAASSSTRRPRRRRGRASTTPTSASAASRASTARSSCSAARLAE